MHGLPLKYSAKAALTIGSNADAHEVAGKRNQWLGQLRGTLLDSLLGTVFWKTPKLRPPWG